MINRHISRALSILLICFSIYLRDNTMNIRLILAILFFIIGITLFFKKAFIKKNINTSKNKNIDVNNIVFTDIITKILGLLMIIFLTGIFIEKPKIYELICKDTQISTGSINLLDMNHNMQYYGVNRKIGFAYDKKVLLYLKSIYIRKGILHAKLNIENYTEEVIKNNPHKFFIEDDMGNKYFLDLFRNAQFKKEILPDKNIEIQMSIEGINRKAKSFTLKFYIDCEGNNVYNESEKYCDIKVDLENLE